MKLIGVDERSLPEWLRTAALDDAVVAPALVNAHDHLHLNRVPPLPQSGYFGNSYDWIDAFQPYFDDPNVRSALAISKQHRLWHGALKNLLSGATTVMHHDPWHEVFEARGFPINVVRGCGWAHSLRLSQSGQYGPSVVESYSATPSVVPWFIHLAEGTDEVASRELRDLDALGCLRDNTVIIHGVGLGDADIDLIIERGARVVWCPGSNLRLFGRTISAHRLRRLFDAGLLAIGTDSRLTGERDLLDEMRIARACSGFSAAELFELATTVNRTTLRTDAGRDDLIVFDNRCGDPHESLLSARRSDLRAVIRCGEPVLIDVSLFECLDSRLGNSNFNMRLISLDGECKFIVDDALAGLGDACKPGLS